MDQAYQTEFSHRSSRVASALYLVTSFFSDQEPLKWRIRDLCIGLVASDVKDKTGVIKDITSLLLIAKNNNLISNDNNEILGKELSKLEEIGESSYSLTFPPENTMPPLPSPAPKPENLEPIKDNIPEPKPVAKPALKEFGSVSVKKNSRQSVIINILKRKKEIMIKDVTPIITGCSEKTIQRELAYMVELGLLKKMGEKRWSRYTLA